MQLSDTQLVILSAASQRNDWHVLPLPDHLKGGAASKVVASLLGKGLIEECDAMRGDPIWRETDDGHGTTLVLTEHAFAALGIAPDDTSGPDAPQTTTGGSTCVDTAPADHDASSVDNAPTAPAGRTSRPLREGTKQATLVAMLRAPEGATIAEIVAITGWQPHTVRGAMAGALKKKLGLNVTSEKSDDRGRVYHVS
jgi:hypothetical protein